MKISEYINRKQLLLEDQGIVTKLVPDNQIYDTVKQLSLSMITDAFACPYCMVYVEDNCVWCPMYNANNECNKSINNTYSQVRDELHNKNIFHLCDVPGLDALIKEYNSELKG